MCVTVDISTVVRSGKEQRGTGLETTALQGGLTIKCPSGEC